MNRSRIDNGSVAVEVVLITPALIALLLLVVLGGRLTGAQSRVRHAAASAARAASLRGSLVVAEADAVAAARSDLERAHVECSGGPAVEVQGSLGPGDRVTVTVRCQVPLRDLGLLGLGRSVHEVSASSVEIVDLRRSS
jgi:Flp pilus assembly protein TadG